MSQFVEQGFIDDLKFNGDVYRLWKRNSYGSQKTSTPAARADETGYVYDEVSVPSDSRILVISGKTMLQQIEAGLVPSDGLSFRYDPNISLIGYLDRFVSPVRRQVATIRSVTRGTGTDYDQLIRPFIQSISYIRQGDTIYVQGTDYQLSSYSGTPTPFQYDRVHWIGVHRPAEGTTYGCGIIYDPVWTVNQNNGQMPMTGASGKYMTITVYCDRWLSGK